MGEPSASNRIEEQRNQRVLESAQAEWDKVTTITAGIIVLLNKRHCADDLHETSARDKTG